MDRYGICGTCFPVLCASATQANREFQLTTSQRVLLPRIIQSFQARKSLRSHHILLMTRLAASLSSFKETQKEDFSALPHADPYRESPPFSRCKSVGQIIKALDEKAPDYFSVPNVTLLRCAIADLSKGKSNEDSDPTAEEILRVLEGRIPWLLTEQGYTLKVRIMRCFLLFCLLTDLRVEITL